MSRIVKISGVVFLFLTCFSVYAQNELNPFKYIIVPKKYEFLKKENQYRVNSMTKYLFEQEGYRTFYQGDPYPDDLNANPCLALTAEVINESSAFTTKLFLALKDCRDQEVFRSAEGRSKIKEFEKTYIDALKKSFVSVQSLNYSFDESLVINAGAIGMVANQQNTEKLKTSTPEVQQANEEVTKTSEPVAAADKTTTVNPAPVAVIPVAVAEEPKKEESVAEVTEEPQTKVESQTIDEPIAEEVATPTGVTAETAVAAETATAVEEKPKSSQLVGGARAFKNEMTTFLLVDQGTQMQAFVSESKNKDYKPGELIGTFKKTSLPNVFRVSWKKPMEGVESTTAYFDDKGNLKIDIEKSGQIQVLTFTEVK